MMFSPELQGQLAQQRIEERLAAASLLRGAQQPRQSIRRQIGHRFMEIGARLAAEPQLESARSR